MSSNVVTRNTNLDGVRKIVREFGLYTSTHGVLGIVRSQSIHNRAFWSICFLAFTGTMLYFVTQSIRAYFQYATQTTIDTVNEWPQIFPAVTICNYSPFRFDQFIGPYLNYTDEYNSTDRSDFSSAQAERIDTFVQSQLNRNEPLDELYYSLDSMLIRCVYNGANCSTKDFTHFISPVYGRCYTFNAQSNNIHNGELHYNNENGDTGILELSLYAHSQQYVPFYSDGTGIMVMLHNNTQLPLVDRVGIQLAPGKKHRLGYTKKINLFLPSPYTTCKDQVTPGMQAMFDQFSGATYTYSEEICFQVAVQTYTYHECGCVSPFEWSMRYVVISGTKDITRAPLCNVSDSCYSEAAARIQASSSIMSIYGAACDLECTSIEFEVKLSSIIAPSEWLMHDIKTFVKSSSVPLPVNWSTTWQTDIQTNYVAMDVVCESTRVTSFTQQPALSGIDVISNVGGQSGLWVGMSFLSLMEVAEMLYRIVRYQCYRIREKILNKKQDKHPTVGSIVSQN